MSDKMVPLKVSEKTIRRRISELTNALDGKAGTAYRGDEFCQMDSAVLEVIIPYLLKPKNTPDAISSLRAMWVDVPPGLLVINTKT